MGYHFATINMGQKVGGAVPVLGGAGSTPNTVSPWPRPTSVRSGTLIHPAVWLQQTWAENWWAVPLRRELSTHLTVWPGPRSISLPSGILIRLLFGHNRHGPTTWGLLCPFLGGELSAYLTQCGLGQGLPPYQVAL